VYDPLFHFVTKSSTLQIVQGSSPVIRWHIKRSSSFTNCVSCLLLVGWFGLVVMALCTSTKSLGVEPS